MLMEKPQLFCINSTNTLVAYEFAFVLFLLHFTNSLPAEMMQHLNIVIESIGFSVDEFDACKIDDTNHGNDFS